MTANACGLNKNIINTLRINILRSGVSNIFDNY